MRKLCRKFNHPMVLFVLIAGVFIWLSRGTLFVWATPHSDLAADMLLQNRIDKEGFLLVGHYSRWGFNHPGPFWFYYNAVAEWLLNGFHLSRPQIWQIGNVFLMILLFFFSCVSLSNFFYKRFNLLYGIVVLTLAVGFVGGVLVSLWMPHRLVVPFLAFLVCLLQLHEGRLNYLPLAVALACMLIHGYATMPVFTLPFIGFAFGIGCSKLNKENRWRMILYPLLIASCVGTFFLAPILIDQWVSPTSNFSKLLAVHAQFKIMPKPFWQDLDSFINELVFHGHTFGWMAVLLVTAVTYQEIDSTLKRRVFVSLMLCILMTLVIFLSYKKTPSPLLPFTAQFYQAVSLLFLSTIMVPFFVQKTRGARLCGYGFIVLVCLSFGAPMFIFRVVNVPDKIEFEQGVKTFAAAIQKNRSHHHDVVVIDYTQHDHWPLIAGLLLELERKNISVCTTWQHMGFLFTERKICHKKQLPDFTIVESEACHKTCIAQVAPFGLKKS